jgi:rhamnosyltransferase
VVTFNPDIEPLCELISALKAQVGHIFIVDNASAEDVASRLPPDCAADVELIRNSQNLGIAAAQNQGALQALAREDCRYVLLSDQDSLPAPYMVRRLRQALEIDRDQTPAPGAGAPHTPFGYSCGRVAAVGPWSIDVRSGARAVLVVDPKGWPVRWLPKPRPARPLTQPQLPYEVSFLIASGSLIPSDVLRTLGGMRSNYFIDHVDTEWCLRTRAAGYRLLIVPEAVLAHRLGDSVRRIWFLGFRQVSHHSPLRDYYMFRNTFLMLRDVRLTSPWRLHLLFRLVLFATYFLLLGNRRLARLWLMGLGIFHGIRRRSGRLDPRTGALAPIAISALEPPAQSDLPAAGSA